MPDIFDYIDLNYHSKSKQEAIVDGILTAISKNEIGKNDPLPSVNKFIGKLGVARMTVVKALNILKERGIIVAEDKVGYFVQDVNVKRDMKVFLFLTGFNSYHEILYNSIIEEITDPNVSIDLFFHHCNPKIFKSVLQENLGSYGLYVITGFNHPSLNPLISKIPKNKLLQIIRPPVPEGISSINQDFYSGLKTALEKVLVQLQKYREFQLIFPLKIGHPEEIEHAFTEFCQESRISYSVVNKLSKEQIKKDVAYFVIEDSDLISLIKMGEEMGFQLGLDMGILSYNETPMKEIIRNGITVVSVDFAKMGKEIARFIMNPSKQNRVFTPEIILRKSL